MNKYMMLLLFFPLVVMAADNSPSFETMSKCAFIYAPIFEAAEKEKDLAAFIYAQNRMAWIGGYFQAHSENKKLEKIFNMSLEDNKKSGSIIKGRFVRAISEGDSAEYVAVLKIANECDLSIGFSIDDAPSPL